MKKMLLILVVLAIIVILGGIAYWLSGLQSEQPAETVVPGADDVLNQDSTSEILDNLEGIYIGDLDKEFENIDADLNQL